MRSAVRFTFIACLVCAQLPALAAEPTDKEVVQFDVSTREISIQSNFTGIEIVVFGSVDSAQPRATGQTPYDVIIVISGPKQALTTWRKERVAGIWMNGASESFVTVPSFYAVLSTRQIETMAAPTTLKTLGIGIENLRLGGTEAEGPPGDDVFRAALVRLKEERRLFQQEEGSVSFIGRSLFRGSVELPATVPLGRYKAQVYLFRDGQLLSKNDSTLEVRKAGVERVVYLLAFRYPFIYGLVAVAIAVLMGAAAWAAFRRE
jgi:uncharacterized protein (TIGR02186 family)